ncbi:LA_3150 family lipoprotein [Leptospira meyeri]|uniref:Lipoprotein n=1 Tax=Leptospira meyeri TaxID=29508 RepID=A0A4R8MUR8_LEPME|nr:hypothetical protein [Leptospira meyeri]PKA24719.1 hypothetical protein CH381_19140 [Leptospira sp. mixed culture ATI2-C-A1]EKJ88339.1 hypothetical protein LEP1GSC017_1867 [Leptospira meyeri serovar Hardjo str. Went 5]EMJ89209.1 hypothetical protein LEP1GSC196_1545 [Leptospira meyeri serovar Semaranga str. Veldrot Semarang 173]MCW7488503.1 hypothetical protein [Leptospira meyeri]PJZ81328.1 hypothetical protein CH359_09675 [Leptospira meyeri]
MHIKSNLMIRLLIILVVSHFVWNCQSKEQNREDISSLVINNLLNGVADRNKSLVVMEVADLGGSFTGTCFDTFQLNGGNIGPTAYFNTPQGGAGGLLNTNIKKYAVSTSSCSDLGFASGTNFGSTSQRPNPNDLFTFKMFTCDPNNNPCTKAAITASGF